MSDHIFKNPEFPTSKLYKTSPLKDGDKKLSFCFEFSSFRGGRICFDNPYQDFKDIIELIKCLKNISNYGLNELYGNQDVLRFHEIDLRHRAYLIDIYKKALNINRNTETNQLPTLWQLEVFTDNKRSVAPRITFYILSDGVAKIVFFDYHHLLCSKVYPANSKIPENWYEHYID